MQIIKKIILSLGVFIFTITILSIISALLINFNIINIDYLHIITLIIGIISYLLLGYIGSYNLKVPKIGAFIIYLVISILILFGINSISNIQINKSFYFKEIIYVISLFIGVLISKNNTTVL